MNKGKYIKQTRTICYRILDDVLPLVKETVELYRSAASHCLSVLKDNTELLRAKDDPDAVTSRKYDLFTIVERLIHRTKNNPKPWYPFNHWMSWERIYLRI